jgi:hypothetical protein
LAKKEQRTIPVHALGDERVHLALPHHGQLRQGRLKTLCGKQAVSELPLFAAIEAKSRCRTCFGKVDEHGYLKEVETVPAAKAQARDAKPGGKVIPLSARKKTGRGESD